MYNLSYVAGMIIVAVFLIWLGMRRHKKAYEKYEKDSQEYSGVTTMTVVSVDKVEDEVWEDRDDGNKVLVPVTYYYISYEYTVNGKTYQYTSRQSTYTTRQVGNQIPGYYDPENPQKITENRRNKPVLSGAVCFVLAIVLIICSGIMIGTGL